MDLSNNQEYTRFSNIGQCTPVEAAFNMENKTEKLEEMVKKHFEGYIKEWTNKLSSSQRNKAKQLLWKHVLTFAVSNEINTAEARSINKHPSKKIRSPETDD